MTAEKKEYREILKASSITGLSSMINVLIKLLRMKILATWLGPTGVGLVGLYQSLVDASSTAFALGFGTAGVRQIAEANGKGDAKAIVASRQALLIATLSLSLIGGASIWLFRESVARYLLDDVTHAGAVGWLALAVSLTVAGSSQLAFLRGMHRVVDIAKITVFGSLVGTIFGVALIYWKGIDGVAGLVLLAPVSAFLFGHWFVAKIPKPPMERASLSALTAQWKVLFRIGSVFMITSVVMLLVNLWLRVKVKTDLGGDALGYFQASWSISAQYLAFIVVAMRADHYPKLTAAINDHTTVNRMINQQTEVSILMTAPVLIAMVAFAPLIIRLLYSAQFVPAAEILRWQTMGDMLKIAAVPLGFLTLAAGDAKAYFLTEVFSRLILMAFVWFALPIFGPSATGMAYLCSYLVYLPVVYMLAKRRTGFRWSRVASQYVIGSVSACAVALICSKLFPHISLYVGALLFLSASLFCFVRLSTAVDINMVPKRVRKLLRMVKKNDQQGT